jgi:TonB family protein
MSSARPSFTPGQLKAALVIGALVAVVLGIFTYRTYLNDKARQERAERWNAEAERQEVERMAAMKRWEEERAREERRAVVKARDGRPTVVPGFPKVDGGRNTGVVHDIFRSQSYEMQHCYDSELTKKADLSGRISVQFTIASSGQVVASSLVGSTIASARLKNCVLEAIRRWKFPSIDGGIAVVSLPLFFEPAGEL